MSDSPPTVEQNTSDSTQSGPVILSTEPEAPAFEAGIMARVEHDAVAEWRKICDPIGSAVARIAGGFKAPEIDLARVITPAIAGALALLDSISAELGIHAVALHNAADRIGAEPGQVTPAVIDPPGSPATQTHMSRFAALNDRLHRIRQLFDAARERIESVV